MRVPHVGPWAIVLLLICLLAACAGQALPIAGPTAASLPQDVAQLVKIAQDSYNLRGAEANIALSFAAAEKAVLLDPENMQANLLSAQAAYWLFEFGGETLDREALAKTGEQRALAVAATDPQNAAGHFFAGAHLGYRVQMATLPKISEMAEVQKRFMQALKLDRNFDQGAPLRALGTLLVRAPAWPTGIGDIDSGIAYLEEAVKLFPDHPANHLYLAGAYKEDGRKAEARAAAQRCLDLLADSAWGAPGVKWKSACEKIMNDVR